MLIKYSLLGEAPIWTYAAAQKCRETPMGITGIIVKVIHNVADKFVYAL